ncbi:MFS transporter [Corynebacterium glyciniphilum]|uniref:MFS transporter n=1 Tax=Corynebacterium glyciniphilum TaxID=1404244 RepID=UPI0011AB7A9B|nr:MFS transporter [Corynebacterium glyciniphilum]
MIDNTSSLLSSRSRPAWVLTGFVLLVFCTGTAEYLVAGVLPQLATDVGVSTAAAGQTVTAYALGVAVGGPLVTILTARLPRKGLALSLGLVFIIGTLITVIAPTYAWVIVGRVVSACSQATLFAIGLTTAAAAMGPGRQGRAIAIVSSGLTVATVLGVPLGALLGGNLNWRIPFLIVAVVAIAGVLILLSSMPRTPAPATGVRDEIRTLVRGPVLLAVMTTVVGFAGVGIVFTYLVPLLSDVTGLAASIIPALLLAYGVGGFVGNLIAGRFADLDLGKTLVGVFAALVLTLALFPLVAEHPAPMIGMVLVLGLLSTATIAPLQSLVLRHAGAAPTLSLAVNVGAFNMANAVGSALGGIGVSAGLLRWGGFGGAVFAVAGLILALLALSTTPQEDNQ